MEEDHNPDYLYKIVSFKQWEETLVAEEVVCSLQDRDFIHLAKEDQISHVIEKFWHAQPCIILKLDPKKLKGKLLSEMNPGGSTYYYHLYNGFIPLAAVSSIESRN